MKFIPVWEEKYAVKVTCSLEKEPLGTAGPIKLAEKLLKENNDSGLFFVFNSDVTCEFPLDKLVSFHKSHGREGTIMLTKVEDPSRFGVVMHESDGKI